MADDEEFDEGYDDSDDDGEDAGTVTLSKRDAQQLRRAANGNKKAKAELIQLQREIAFAKAGVDLDSPVGKLFNKAYDGDVDVAKIQAEAASLNALRPDAQLLETTTAPTGNVDSPTISDAEKQATQERQTLASGATSDERQVADPREIAMAYAHESVEHGTSRENAQAEYLDDILWAAANGNKKVIWDAGTHFNK